MKDYYRILGVKVTSTTEEIKRTFRLKALKIHPDKSGRDTKEEFIELFEAYSILSDKKKRSRYNKIYDWIDDQAIAPSQETEPNEIYKISAQANAYARDFKSFQREVLDKILFGLILTLDKMFVG